LCWWPLCHQKERVYEKVRFHCTQDKNNKSTTLVNTKANLNSEVLADICLVCGLPQEGFTDQAVFVDTFLLKRRNGIAHGESTFIGLDDLDQLADDTVSIMRQFGDLLENRVYLKDYRAA
jgi:hypothetical protein